MDVGDSQSMHRTRVESCLILILNHFLCCFVLVADTFNRFYHRHQGPGSAILRGAAHGNGEWLSMSAT